MLQKLTKNDKKKKGSRVGRKRVPIGPIKVVNGKVEKSREGMGKGIKRSRVRWRRGGMRRARGRRHRCVCVCVCVCEREREKEGVQEFVAFCM